MYKDKYEDDVTWINHSNLDEMPAEIQDISRESEY